MKTTIRTIAALTVAILALVSCNKESIKDKEDAQTDVKERVITLSFAGTKTALSADNLTPAFEANDPILVTDGTSTPVECRVEINDGVATITTTLTGTLTAVYPASAAEVSGNNITGIKVPTVQDGTFASANICKATIPAGSTSAVFQNQTAVFRINPPYVAENKAKYVEVITARPKIANVTGQLSDSTYFKLNKVHAAVNASEAGPGSAYYLSILVPASDDPDLAVTGGLRICDVSFADGYNLKTLKSNTEKIKAGTIYDVTNMGWSEAYVEVEGMKWATRNIGAESSTDAGLYFMWGETTGNEPYDTEFDFPYAEKYYSADNTTWDGSWGFTWANCPYTNGEFYEEVNTNVFTKYTGSDNDLAKSGTADGKTVLDLCDDVANANWGGSWRMPTKEEFNAFIVGAEYESGNFTHKEVTFPAAGYGAGTDLRYVDDRGYYWSSSLSTFNSLYAYCLRFLDGRVDRDSDYRYIGCSVRALSD